MVQRGVRVESLLFLVSCFLGLALLWALVLTGSLSKSEDPLRPASSVVAHGATDEAGRKGMRGLAWTH